MSNHDASFKSDETGAMTGLGLFLIVACFVIGGLALDVSSAYKARTELQATADAAAHAALYVRDSSSETVAIQAALDVVEEMMPYARYGNTIDSSMVQFGTWDGTNHVFTPSAGSDDAVFVDMSRAESRSNPVGTYFLTFAGINNWNVRRGSVFETYKPTCFREGMVADDVVDVQSNNDFVNGFCVHSNTYVSVNIDNNFESGTIVSMPDERDIDMPAGGFTKNPGLQSALRDGAYQLRILNDLPTIFADLSVAGPDWTPSYITSSIIQTVPVAGGPKRMVDLVSGSVHVVSCSGSQKLQIAANELIEDVVVVTDCKIVIGANVELRDVTLATTNTGADSISGSLVSLGVDDNCGSGNGASLMTYGGINFSSDLEMFGSQMIARGDIDFQARANGIEGASIIAGGQINTNSLIGMGFCGGSGMDNIYEAEYFRMVN